MFKVRFNTGRTKSGGIEFRPFSMNLKQELLHEIIKKSLSVILASVLIAIISFSNTVKKIIEEKGYLTYLKRVLKQILEQNNKDI